MLHFSLDEVIGYAVRKLNEPKELEDVVLGAFILPLEELQREELTELIFVAKNEPITVVDEHSRVE